jgi:hypothetical protein
VAVRTCDQQSCRRQFCHRCSLLNGGGGGGRARHSACNLNHCSTTTEAADTLTTPLVQFQHDNGAGVPAIVLAIVPPPVFDWEQYYLEYPEEDVPPGWVSSGEESYDTDTSLPSDSALPSDHECIDYEEMRVVSKKMQLPWLLARKTIASRMPRLRTQRVLPLAASGPSHHD